MTNFIQFRRSRRQSTSSVYMQLISSLANDLDHMLSELCTTPPPPYDRLSDNELHNRSDAFLEPFVQGLNYTNRKSPDITEPAPPTCQIGQFVSTPTSRSASRESFISSNGGSEAGSEDSDDTGYGAACDIGLVERLTCTHQIWFLPGIQRAGAFHLLQGKEEGCFVVRQSSQPDTMALSVRLPPDKGPYIEHYLIQSTEGRVGLETSENRFDSIYALIAHYASCCDELPVQLILPKNIRDAKSRQQLISYALLGQEFWRYSPPPSSASSPDADLVLNLNPLASTFKTAEPATPTTFRDLTKPIRPNTLNLLSKIDPIKNEPIKNDTKMESLKLNSLKSETSSKTPPPPPPRWSKPTTPQNQNNFTVTTTVTFTVNSQSPKGEEGSSNMDITCDPKRVSPEGQCSTISSKSSHAPEQITSPSGSILSPQSDPSSIISSDTLSPLSHTKPSRRSRRTRHKASTHYQESDILESPTVYCSSAVGDKISDYEDLWTNDHLKKSKNNPTRCITSPDILQNTGNIISLNNNIISPNDHVSNPSHCSTPNITADTQNICQDLQSPKQNSPFYAEPADSLGQVPRRFYDKNLPFNNHRHSNPPALSSHFAQMTYLGRTDSSDINGHLSSSVDNLSPKLKIRALKKPEVKPVPPPMLHQQNNDTWKVDSSWKFLSNDCDVNMESDYYDSDWPATVPNFMHLSPYTPDVDERNPVQEMIAKRFPNIRTSTEITTDDELSRISAYDNVDEKRISRAPPSEISELTEFSDPWNEVTNGVVTNDSEETSDDYKSAPKTASINRTKSFKDRLDPLLSAPRLQALRNKESNENRPMVGTEIRNCAFELAQDKSTTFAQNIDNFIACTLESKESNPQIVMRNMRQFMSGIKNYLVKHGEKGFNKVVERERNKLKSTEFLNLDAILEGVLHRLVVSPLKAHLEKLFFDHYTKTGAIKVLKENIEFASKRPTSELAIKSKLCLPSESALKTISNYLNRLQTADSPLEKLEYLLASIATIFNSVKTGNLTGSGRVVTLAADDFLPLFVWVLVKTRFVTAEIEAEYMWGLLHPSLLSGEGGYYLTTLSSAVHVLKNFKENKEDNIKNMKTDSVLKVVVPDELHGSILTKTLPARPHMTTKEVCKIIAHKARITNPQDYALYRLIDGEETMLGDNECPQDFMNQGKHVMLAYKRIDAKIAWPKQQSN